MSETFTTPARWRDSWPDIRGFRYLGDIAHSWATGDAEDDEPDPALVAEGPASYEDSLHRRVTKLYGCTSCGAVIVGDMVKQHLSFHGYAE